MSPERETQQKQRSARDSFLERVLKAIDDEPEYPDDDELIDKVKEAMMQFPGVSETLAQALTETVIECARVSVRETKKEIRKRILSL